MKRLVLALLFAVPAFTARGELDEVPGPITPSTGLPTPAQWPVLRYEQPLRLLLVAGKGEAITPYQRIARRLRATLDVRYCGVGGDAIYHVNDKWIEPEKNPTIPELGQAIQQAVVDVLDPQRGDLPYDVMFMQAYPPDALTNAVISAHLLHWVRAGRLLVVTGNFTPPAGSAFAPDWPARPTAVQSYLADGAVRADGPGLAGVPTSWLSAWTFMRVPEATPGSTALATGGSGGAFLRHLGRGAILYVPSGPMSRFHDAIRKFGRQYDHDEIWLRFWDQVLHETVRGASAVPVYTDLQPNATNGVVLGKIVNRSFAGKLAVSVHVTTPRGQVVFAKEEILSVAVGQSQPYEIHVPVSGDWASGLYPVYLTVGDPTTKKQLHQSLEFLPVTGDVELQLTTDKRGYRFGEDAKLTLTASSRTPWSGELCFGVYDFRGRLLGASTQPATLTTNAQPFTFTYRMADHGVRVDTFWAEVIARKAGHDSGWAEAKFYKYEPWSMRNEYQWSTWARIGCGPPSLVLPGMRLMAHAGMNSLGNPGAGGIAYAAERWGWRFYDEGTGMNTFQPVIEYENDAEIEAQLLKEAAGIENSPEQMAYYGSATYVLASIQEEGGFKNGWGQRYYWDTPVAPEKACRAFRWYLKLKYPGIKELNAAWKTNFGSWEEVKLTKEFSAMTPPTLAADGWAHPKDSPTGGNVTGVTVAPYTDSLDFYNWYYDKIIYAAKRIFAERINPVAKVTASAPTIGTDKPYDVRLGYPSVWNESQWDSTYDGPEPSYGLIWGHFDSAIKTENNLWGWLLVRSGHMDYWVDILNFNCDLTHTRSSFAMRAWTHKLAGHERIILDSHPLPTEVGLLNDNGLPQDLYPRKNMGLSVQVALNQGGFGLPAVNPTNLQPYKIVFAIGHQSVSPDEAARLTQFVEAGGTLVFTARFANEDQYTTPVTVSPGQGLAEKWGLQMTQTTNGNPQVQIPARLDSLGDKFKGLVLSSHETCRETVKQTGWQELAHYADGTPAVLTRQSGRGRLICLNALYQSHAYIQWVTPTGPERLGFYRLIEWCCENAGVQRRVRLDGDLKETLHIALKQFTDPTGKINYVIARTSGEVPWVKGQLNWLGAQPVGYDVFDGGMIGRTLPLNFKPGAGKFLAFVEKPVKKIHLQAAASIKAGEPIKLTVQIRDADNKPVAGAFPLELRVESHPSLSRSFSLEDDGTFTLNTALSDLPGSWTITVTDGITGQSGSTRVTVKPSKADGPGFWTLGWPSELAEPLRLSTEQFLTGLRALSTLYRADHTGDNWMTKQRLCYYYDNFPDTRHAYLRPLNDVDWPDYSDAIRTALLNGETFVLTGEDLGVDPRTGLGTYAHHDAKQMEALVKALHGATWTLVTPDGDTIAATLGKGRLVLCRESIDAAGERNLQIIRWDKRWLATQTASTSIKTPTLAKLKSWWNGQEAITTGPRSVTWFGDNYLEQSFKLEPGKAINQPDPNWPWPTSTEGTVFYFVVPPTGEVKEVSLTVTGNAQFDVGCDGTPDTDWTSAVAQAARTTPYRDGNGWRIIPVRVTVTAPTEVKLSNLNIRVQ